MTEPRLGFGLPVSGSWSTPTNIVRVACRAEELGYGSVWTLQRLLVPADGDLGETYRSVQDPIVTLAYVAAVTERVRLGLAIVNAPFFSPITLAKQLTSLDVLSSGRLEAGLGLGWSPDEFQAAGVPYQRRGARMEEFLEHLIAIWTDEVVSYDGEFYSMPPARVDPKPVQRPHPPILLGGGAEPALRRIGRLADGWISSSRQDLSRIGDDIEVVKAAAREAGRDPERLSFVVRGVIHPDAPPTAEARLPLHGTIEEIKTDISRLGVHGVTDFFIDLNFEPTIGSPDADPAVSMRRAEELLEAFAPN